MDLISGVHSGMRYLKEKQGLWVLNNNSRGRMKLISSAQQTRTKLYFFVIIVFQEFD